MLQKKKKIQLLRFLMEIRETVEKVMEGLTYLLAAVESLTFLPSKEAKCCSRASRRLLGACCDRKTHCQQVPERWTTGVHTETTEDSGGWSR